MAGIPKNHIFSGGIEFRVDTSTRNLLIIHSPDPSVLLNFQNAAKYAVGSQRLGNPHIYINSQKAELEISSSLSIIGNKNFLKINNILLDHGVKEGFFSQPEADAAKNKFGISIILSIVPPAQIFFEGQNALWIEAHEQELRKLGLTDDDLAALKKATSLEQLKECKYDIGQGVFSGSRNLAVQGRLPLFTGYFDAAADWEKALGKGGASIP